MKDGRVLKKMALESGLSEELEALAREVISAAIEVHRVLGPGFPESIYQAALEHELGLRRITFVAQAPLPVVYKGVLVGEGRADVIVAEQLIVELKAVDDIHPVHEAQVLAYRKAARLQLGLLINFNVPVLTDGLRRIINSH